MASFIRPRSIFGIVVALLLIPAIGFGDDSSSASATNQQGRNRQSNSDSNYSQRDRNQNRNQSQSNDRDQSNREWQNNESGNYYSSSSNSDRQRLLRAYRAGYFTGFESGYQQAADDHTLVFELNPSGQDQSNDLGLERRVKLTGDVASTRNVSVPQSDTKHLIALIKTDDGDRCLVDLGPANDLQKLDLSKGDEVTVRGIRARVGDHTIVFADQIKANDQTVSVPFEKAGSSSDQSASQGQQVSSDLNRTLDQLQTSQNNQARRNSSSDKDQR